MTFYFDALERAIRQHINPDVNDALANASWVELDRAIHSVQVPLQADVAVAYEKNFARFVIIGRCLRYGKGEYLNIEAAFDTKPIKSSYDAAQYIEHVFEQAKRRMLAQLAEDGFAEMFKESL